MNDTQKVNDNQGVPLRSLTQNPWGRRHARDLNGLAAGIDEYAGVLRLSEREAMSMGCENWWQFAHESLESACEAHQKSVPDEGWFHLHAARRCRVMWADEGLRQAWVVHLRNEAAKKLSGWRRKTSLDLLGGDCSPDRVSRSALYWAMQIRDEDAGNQYRVVALLKDKLALLAWILVALLLVMIVLSIVSPLPFESPGLSSGRLPLVVSVMLFGAIGGAVSAIMPVSTTRKGRLPEQLMGWSVTVLRPLIGAAAALGSYALLQAGLVTVGNGNPGTYLAIAFIAGFSERWLIQNVARVVGDSGDPGAKEDKASEPEPVTPALFSRQDAPDSSPETSRARRETPSSNT